MSSRGQGLRAWLLQRVTAVYLAVYIPAAALWLAAHTPLAFPTWREWFALPAVAVATGLFFVSLLAHAWVGMRDIVIDYVHPDPWRYSLLALLALALVAMGFWVALVLFSAVAI